MENTLKQGGSILFLVPEVALAPQTVSRLRMHFQSEKLLYGIVTLRLEKELMRGKLDHR